MLVSAGRGGARGRRAAGGLAGARGADVLALGVARAADDVLGVLRGWRCVPGYACILYKRLKRVSMGQDPRPFRASRRCVVWLLLVQVRCGDLVHVPGVGLACCFLSARARNGLETVDVLRDRYPVLHHPHSCAFLLSIRSLLLLLQLGRPCSTYTHPHSNRLLVVHLEEAQGIKVMFSRRET